MKRHRLLDRTLGPVVVGWIERNLVHGPGDVQGEPIELDDGPRGEIRRVGKIDERKPIDAVPALALAVWRAVQAQATVCAEHDMIVL